MRISILIMVLFAISIPFYAQMVGINTDNPTATLDIKTSEDASYSKLMRVENSQGAEVFTVKNNGNIGIGVSDPKVRLDVRNTNRKSEIGIGDTDKSPTDVGAGTIRYSSRLNQLHFSTGSEWRRFTSLIERPYIIARNNTKVFTIPDKTPVSLSNFSIVKDSYQSFDSISSVFTAPIEGVYIFSFSVVFKSDVVPANSYIEASWITSSSDTIKSVQYYPIGGTGITSINCYGSLRLTVGETIRPMIYHNFGGDRQLIVDPKSLDATSMNYNNIFIFAL